MQEIHEQSPQDAQGQKVHLWGLMLLPKDHLYCETNDWGKFTKECFIIHFLDLRHVGILVPPAGIEPMFLTFVIWLLPILVEVHRLCGCGCRVRASPVTRRLLWISHG